MTIGLWILSAVIVVLVCWLAVPKKDGDTQPKRCAKCGRFLGQERFVAKNNMIVCPKCAKAMGI